jgi:hypothetical protein
VFYDFQFKIRNVNNNGALLSIAKYPAHPFHVQFHLPYALFQGNIEGIKRGRANNAIGFKPMPLLKKDDRLFQLLVKKVPSLCPVTLLIT